MQKISKQYHNNITAKIILLDIIVVCRPTFNKTLNFNIISELIYNSTAVLKLANNFHS